MYGGLVKFVVKPGMKSEFLEFLRWDAKVAKDTEPGHVAIRRVDEPGT
jgi:hypothetical protein